MIRATWKVLLRKELKRITLNIYFILIITFVITDISCFIIGLSAKLYRRVIPKLPSYWVASNKLFDCKIRTVSLGIRFETETHVCFLINSVIFVYILTKNKISLLVVFSPGFYHLSNCIFFYLGFISRPFTNDRTKWKDKGISLTRDYHFHPHHRNLDTSRVITAESLPLHIASSRIRNGNLWFSSASC